MLPLIQLGLGLLQGKQKDDEARKQNAAAAYMGQAPTASTGNSKGALTSSLTGMLGGLGGGAAGAAASSLGSARYDDKMPEGGGLTQGTANFLDDTFGKPGTADMGQHQEPDGDELPDSYYFKDDEIL